MLNQESTAAKPFSPVYRVPSGHNLAIGMAILTPFLLATLPIRASMDGVSQVLLAPYYLVAIAVMAIVLNSTRVSVRISSRCIRVVNPIREFRVDWMDVRRLDFGYHEGWVLEHCAVIETQDGKRIPLAGVADRTYIRHPSSTPAREILDALQRAHAAALANDGELPESQIAVSGSDRIWKPSTQAIET